MLNRASKHINVHSSYIDVTSYIEWRKKKDNAGYVEIQFEHHVHVACVPYIHICTLHTNCLYVCAPDEFEAAKMINVIRYNSF